MGLFLFAYHQLSSSMIFIKSASYKRIWVKCMHFCTFLKDTECHGVQRTCVTYLHCGEMSQRFICMSHCLYRQAHQKMHLLMLRCLYVVEISGVRELESLVVSVTAQGHGCGHTREICCLLENHMRNKSFQIDRSAKAHVSLDGCLPLWQLV